MLSWYVVEQQVWLQPAVVSRSDIQSTVRLELLQMISLWDLGNVLVDWNPETILQRLDATEEETRLCRQELLEHPDWRHLDAGTVTEQQVTHRLVNELGLTSQVVAQCFHLTRETLVDIDETVKLITELKAAGQPLYCLSNMSHNTYAHIRDRNYFRLFDGIIISAQEKLLKPQPQIFQLVVDRFELDAADVIFIDDLEENIAGAREAGMHGYVFKRSPECYQYLRETLKV